MVKINAPNKDHFFSPHVLCHWTTISLPSVWSCPAVCSWCRIPPADSSARWSQNPQTPPCWGLWSPAEGEEEETLILDSLMEGFTSLYFWHVFRREGFLRHPSLSTPSNFTSLKSQVSEVCMYDRVQKPHVNLNRHRSRLRVKPVFLKWLWRRQKAPAGTHFKQLAANILQSCTEWACVQLHVVVVI